MPCHSCVTSWSDGDGTSVVIIVARADALEIVVIVEEVEDEPAQCAVVRRSSRRDGLCWSKVSRERLGALEEKLLFAVVGKFA